MKKRRVMIVPLVREQIREQVEYIAGDSLDNALAWEKRLRGFILGLGSTGGIHAEDRAASARLGFIVHKVVFERTYLIHYHIDEKARVVRVVNFRHGARLPRAGEP